MTSGTMTSAPLPQHRASRRTLAPSRGYTAVELLMAMAVLAVGIVGIISMQKITVVSNQHAKNLAIATHVAQAWLGMLDAEGSVWNEDGSFSRTTWLAQGDSSTGWFRPNYDTFRNFGPSFDALGNPLLQADEDPNARFCVDLRFTPLTANFDDGAGLIRTEVRVIWMRSGTPVISGSATPISHACEVPAVQVATADQRRLFHTVFMSGAVRQNARQVAP